MKEKDSSTATPRTASYPSQERSPIPESEEHSSEVTHEDSTTGSGNVGEKGEVDPHLVSPSAEVSLQELGELMGTPLASTAPQQGNETQLHGSTPSLIVDKEEESAVTKEVAPEEPPRQSQKKLEPMASAPPENERAVETVSSSAAAIEQNVTLGMAPGGLSDDLMSELFGAPASPRPTTESEAPLQIQDQASPRGTAMYLPAFGAVEAEGATTTPNLRGAASPQAPQQPASSSINVGQNTASGVRGTAMYLPAMTDVAVEQASPSVAPAPAKAAASRPASEARISVGPSTNAPSPRGTAMYLEAISPEQEAHFQSSAAPPVATQPPLQSTAPQSGRETAMYIPAMDAPPTVQMNQPRAPGPQPPPQSAPAWQPPQPQAQSSHSPHHAAQAYGAGSASLPPVQPRHAQQQSSWADAPAQPLPHSAAPSDFHPGGEPVRVVPTPSFLELDDYEETTRPTKNRTWLWVSLLVLFAAGAAAFFLYRQNSAPALFKRAQEAFSAGKCKEALPLLQNVLRKEPQFKGAHSLLGQCQFKLKLRDKALVTLNGALRLDKNDAQSLWLTALLLEKKGTWSESRARLQRLVKLDSGKASFWDALGRLNVRLGETKTALKAHRRAIKLETRKASFWNNLGAALLRLAQEKGSKGDSAAFARQAEANFKKALTLSPQLGAALRNQGDALLLQASLQEQKKEREEILARAERAYKQARLLFPNDAGLLFQMGRLKIQQFQYQKAVPLLNMALTEYKGDSYASHPNKKRLQANTLYNLSVALEGAGKRKDATTRMQESLQLRPNNADGHCRLGQLLRRERKRKEAKAAYARCLQLDPADKDAKKYAR